MDEEITKELIDEAVSNPANASVTDLSDKTAVYFDQKAWGATWEAANSLCADEITLDTLAKRSADELDFVYPFSIENLIETTSADDLEFRTEVDVSDDYRYQTISRIRRRFDRLEEDLEVLDENHDSLGEELRDVICEDD